MAPTSQVNWDSRIVLAIAALTGEIEKARREGRSADADAAERMRATLAAHRDQSMGWNEEEILNDR